MSPFRLVASLASLTAVLVLVSAPTIAAGQLPRSLPFCPAGMPEPAGAPVTVPSFDDPTACQARPTRVEPATTGGLPVPATAPAGSAASLVPFPAPAGSAAPLVPGPLPARAVTAGRDQGSYHHLGVTTAGEWSGVRGRLMVRDPGVRAGTYDFVATRFMAKQGTGEGRVSWLEAGWAETGWSGGGAQRVYAFDSVRMSWLFFEDYRIGDGDQVWVHLQDESGQWRAWLWWGDRWQLLASATLPAGGGAMLEQYVEVHRAAGGQPAGNVPQQPPAAAAAPADPAIPVPRILVDQVRVRATADAPLQSWHAEQVPTMPPLVVPGYCLAWESRYDTWSAGGCPVTVQG